MSQCSRVPRIILGAAMFASPAIAMACCPGGGSGTPAAKGLGESAPKATNLSADPEWSVYEFLRDGISYLQINDSRGVVRAAVGRIDSTAWVMPMGADVESVAVAPSSMVGTIIYSSDHFVVRALKGSNGVSWVVVPVTKK
ncbi:hypothetical protein F0H33_09710 [Xanthomonas translucens pv. undulosa]|nr:hypothetical protein F0H33_09710 [Xanthomonas translucens pv. undulosa]QSQ58354.1 hypothetical protein ISN37_09120 [Xanthomonas translucens pv. undulosa]UKE41656.1 hypothetical protein KCU58_11045 [Xanthomonas translucens pv. undulosa]